MENIALLQIMLDKYNKLSFTHRYILGFHYKKNIYLVEADASVLPYVLTIEKASSKNGGGYGLRFNPNNEQKVLLLSKGAQVLCSKDFFDNAVMNSKYNRGEIFEKMVTEKCGQMWKKDNIPFFMGGDLTVDGVAYQLKFEKATFVNEATLARL